MYTGRSNSSVFSFRDRAKNELMIKTKNGRQGLISLSWIKEFGASSFGTKYAVVFASGECMYTKCIQSPDFEFLSSSSNMK